MWSRENERKEGEGRGRRGREGAHTHHTRVVQVVALEYVPGVPAVLLELAKALQHSRGHIHGAPSSPRPRPKAPRRGGVHRLAQRVVVDGILSRSPEGLNEGHAFCCAQPHAQLVLEGGEELPSSGYAQAAVVLKLE